MRIESRGLDIAFDLERIVRTPPDRQPDPIIHASDPTWPGGKVYEAGQ